MEIPRPDVLIEQVRALPAGGPLLARIGDRHGVHLVGGAVRDLLLGLSPSDLDLVAEGDLAELVDALGGELRAYDRFGTATVRVDGHTYDVTRARSERYAHPGALPEVSPATLEDDLARRDFTVNAAAIELSGPHAGSLRAVPQALDDLEARSLRVLHDQSFIDDPTRLLRLVRYRSRLCFEIEPATLGFARSAIDGDALRTVSGPRVGAELRRLVHEPDPVAAVRALSDLDLALRPGFALTDAALARRAVELLGPEGDAGAVVIAVASQGIPEAELAEWLDDLAFVAATRDAIVAVATQSHTLAGRLQTARTPSQIAAAADEARPELVALAGALGAEPQAREWLERLRHVRLEIDGGDLLSAGIAEGPAVGHGLRAALDAKLDGLTDGRDAELAEALRAAR